MCYTSFIISSSLFVFPHAEHISCLDLINWCFTLPWIWNFAISWDSWHWLWLMPLKNLLIYIIHKWNFIFNAILFCMIWAIGNIQLLLASSGAVMQMQFDFSFIPTVYFLAVFLLNLGQSYLFVALWILRSRNVLVVMRGFRLDRFIYWPFWSLTPFTSTIVVYLLPNKFMGTRWLWIMLILLPDYLYFYVAD